MFQTLAADLLVDGTFNVNSTSVDAWASQLASLRGQAVKGVIIRSRIVIRFLEYQSNDTWSKIRKLSDKEINLLAYKIVEQVKLRGPFLSYADFVNRRLQGNQFDLFAFEFEEWNDSEKKETRIQL